MYKHLYYRKMIPSNYETDIFRITEEYKDNPSKGLALINKLLKREYPCLENKESFVYTSYPYPCVYFVNNNEKKKYAYNYFIRIHENENEANVADLYVKRDWDWSETVLTKRTYIGPFKKEKTLNSLLFYLKDGEGEDFVKKVMENLVIEDLKKEGFTISRDSNDIRTLEIKTDLYE